MAPTAGTPRNPAPSPEWEVGLSTRDVEALRARFGFNEIKEEKRNPVLVFLAYYWGPIPWMIEIAAALALLVQHWTDLAIILVLLGVNGIVGFWEERQAGNAIAALREKLALQARVLRDGRWKVIPAREIVPGDRVRVRLGDIVPADLTLSGLDELEVDQSALTGESLPVTKHGGDTLYSSSLVKRGESDGLVSATGTKTFFGRTADLVQTAHTVSHFQRAVLKIGNYLIVTAIVLASLIEGASLLRGTDLLSSLQFALIITVAAIPVAMPTVLSVTMAVGARRIAHQQAVVTRLSAMEELAGMDILCSDKTGTLTQNRLTLGDPYATLGETPEGVLVTAALASRVENQDPIDLAILAQVIPASLSGFTPVEYHPFDPMVKRTEATVRDRQGATFSVSKGACQVIFALTGLAGGERERAERAVNEFASRGFRTLGVARTDPGGTWQFLGVLPFYDPLRPDAREVVARAREDGVAVKILTGDQLAIGEETSRQLGLGTDFLPAEAVRAVSEGPAPSAGSLDRADGFAQVFPEDKYAIVERFQQEGHIVGMTGDGVNDAPALKKADVGVAVSGATDAARGAASIVLLAPGLSVLVDAIAESRRIFGRMTSYAIYRVGETLRILLLLSFSILIFDLYPVTTVMIVLLAVLNDGAILSIAYDRAEASSHPERWDMGAVMTIAAVLGIVGVAFTFLLFYLALQVWAIPFAIIQVMIYLKLSVAGHLGIFATRTKGPFWSSRPATILLLAVVGTQLVATGIALSGWLFPALTLPQVLVVWGFGFADLLVFDVVKRGAYRTMERRRAPGRSHREGWTRLHGIVSPGFYRRRYVARPGVR